ncbi:MAG: glycosyltransferase family 39 protein [Chloroflexota bacterium]
MRARSDTRWLWAVLVIGIVAAFLLIAAWQLQMHPDEVLSYTSTDGDLAFTLDIQMSVKDNQAPLWFVSFWTWRQIVGDAEYTSRIFSVLAVMLALALIYRLGRRWFRSEWVALLAPLLLLGNGLFFNYALDIRPYPLVMLCAALSMWAFTRWLAARTSRTAAVYGVSVSLLLYVHYLLIFLVVAQGIYYLLTQPLRLRQIRQATLAVGIGIALWLPWAPTFVNQVVGLRNVELESGTARGAAGIGVSTQATTPETILVLLNFATNHLIWLYAAVLIIGVVLLRRKAFYWLALAWALGVPLIALLANFVVAVYAPRFVSHALLGLALALAAVLVALPRRSGLFGAMILIGANLLTFPATIPVRVPYRDLYHQMSELGHSGDAVLLVKAGEIDGFVLWQYQHYLAPELQAGITLERAQAARARRVWFLTNDWFDPVVRAQFDQLEPSHPVQQVLGQCDNSWCYLAQLMEAPPFNSPERFGANVDFWGVDVDAVTPETVQTRLWWRVAQTPSLDYSISLRLIDETGAVVAQNDGPINHYGTEIVQTSQLEPGRIYIDWRALSLPPALRAGVYTLELVVYQSWDNRRLLLHDGSDAMTLDSFTIS